MATDVKINILNRKEDAAYDKPQGGGGENIPQSVTEAIEQLQNIAHIHNVRPERAIRKAV
ncbi:MAG: hypothetical protein OSJ54_12435 [Oscillospiraceae bacterium]|nr:hypothetical protein [Oscillospiraceae bacterium]